MAVLLSLAVAAFAISGCSEKPDVMAVEAKQSLDAEVLTAERPYFNAARPFAEAIAARDYSRAYGYLSSHAKARMSLNQFVAPADDATEEKNNAAAIVNPGPEGFARMLAATEKEYGTPTKIFELNVFSTSPAALSGKGTSPEERLDAMFAIGMMPDSIPVGIRKASLRGALGVELSPERLAETAKAMNVSAEQLKKDPGFRPYTTLKIVVVEEAGALKVGYFEFLPPGLLD